MRSPRLLNKLVGRDDNTESSQPLQNGVVGQCSALVRGPTSRKAPLHPRGQMLARFSTRSASHRSASASRRCRVTASRLTSSRRRGLRPAVRRSPAPATPAKSWPNNQAANSGIGKTRLALQIAGELVRKYADGAFFVSLAAIADPSLVSGTIAKILGVREVGGRSVEEVLKQQLMGKELLLVLDNFEHLQAAAPQVGDLLDACPRLSVLVTSRTVLRMAREHVFEVPPLVVPPPDQDVDMETLGGYEAIRLFCERALAVQADFVLSTKNIGAVASICRRLDGLPLAIELAAARVRLFTPQALLRRLSSSLDLLTGGPR